MLSSSPLAFEVAGDFAPLSDKPDGPGFHSSSLPQVQQDGLSGSYMYIQPSRL